MDPNETLRRFWACIDAENTVGARSAFADLKAWLDRGGFPPAWNHSERDLFFGFNHRRGECDVRRLLMPDAGSFWDVFDAWADADHPELGDRWVAQFPFEDYCLRTGKRSQETIPIKAWCSVSSPDDTLWSIHVRARPAVLDLVRANMIAAGVNDQVSWKMTWRKSKLGRRRDNVLISTTNSVIIGGAWVAIVDASSMPDFEAWPGGVGYAPSDDGDVECFYCGRRYWSGEGSQHEARCPVCEAS